MRIVAGILRNRRFDVPNEAVRPTKEQVREAVFSSLGGYCEGLRVLDLFAGSGGLGLEAWSRGAEDVVLVEKNPLVFRTLQKNIQSLQSEELGTISPKKADAIQFLKRSHQPFDLILADPPYDLPDALPQTLEAITSHSALTSDGTLVYELRSSASFQIPEEWELVKNKTYGLARVLMLRRREKDSV